jgi:hypothetical protein
MSTFESGHALLVGVGADLPNTEDDAKGLAQILSDQERCAYPAKNVVALTGEDATRSGVLGALDGLAARADANATVVLFFSGHGYQVSSSMGEKYFLMPYGYDVNALVKTAISGKEFADKLKAIPAKRMLVLLDCCHAGGVGEGEGEKSPGLTLSKAPLPPEAQSVFAKGAGRAMIASSTAEEKSFAGRPYSAFTLALIEALAGEGAAKNDGYVRWTDLAMHAREMVPQRTKKRQHPIIDLEQADNFVLAYYAGGSSKPKGLPFDVTPEIEPEPGAFREAGDTINAQSSQGLVNRPTGPVTQHFGNEIHTAGGAYVSGPLTVGSGGFVGRDRIVHRDQVQGDKVGGDKIAVDQVSGTGIAIGRGAHARVDQGLTGAELERLFSPLVAIVAAADPGIREEAHQKLMDLKSEVAKADKAGDGHVATLIDGLVRLVPAAIGTVTSIFATPLLAGVAGNVTKFVLKGIQRD